MSALQEHLLRGSVPVVRRGAVGDAGEPDFYQGPTAEYHFESPQHCTRPAVGRDTTVGAGAACKIPTHQVFPTFCVAPCPCPLVGLQATLLGSTTPSLHSVLLRKGPEGRSSLFHRLCLVWVFFLIMNDHQSLNDQNGVNDQHESFLSPAWILLWFAGASIRLLCLP